MINVGRRKPARILFVSFYKELATFMERDLRILQRNYDVTEVKCFRFGDILLLIEGVLSTDLCFIWFGGKVAAFTVFLSKLFRKKSIVVAGGGDVAKVPEINYGAMLHPISKFFVKFSFRYADFVLAVSDFTRMEVLKYTRAYPARVKTVYHGFDFEDFSPREEKDDLVVTISGVSWGTPKLKGLEAFVKSAKYVPHVKFLLIGWHIDGSIKYLKSMSTPNVEFIGYVPFRKLLNYLRRAKVYVQVSYRESFGCALAEAMLCECVPVVTRSGAIPEVVGDVGVYVPYGDPKRTALGIQKALASRKGKDARERIVKKFPQIKREQALKKIIGSLLNE